MMAKCPKCGTHISAFSWKPTCRECGVYIPYFDLEKRLEADADKAEREWEKVDRFLEHFKKHPEEP